MYKALDFIKSNDDDLSQDRGLISSERRTCDDNIAAYSF